MSVDYPLKTGEADRLRLERLGRMYNPAAQQFLLDNGLKSGMTVLEIGCGAGDMACWLSEQVGDKGKVVALDINQDQLDIVAEKIKANNIKNIELACLNLEEVESLEQQFDLIYGRWVITFSSDPEQSFQKLANVLKPGGMLTYETASHVGEGYFSYPETPVVKQWFDCSYQLFKQNNFNPQLGYELYHVFNRLGLQHVNVRASQAIMVTPEEKSVMYFASRSIPDEMLKFMSQDEYEQYLKDLEAFMESDAIGGFYRNILAAGVKS